MSAIIIADVDIQDMEKNLLRNKLPIPQSSEKYLKYSHNQILKLCVNHGLYQLPTTELIKWHKRLDKLFDKNAEDSIKRFLKEMGVV